MTLGSSLAPRVLPDPAGQPQPPARPSPAALVQRIVLELEERIVLGRFRPRQRLVEDDLMALWDAKRHTVREALAEVERMGLVRRTPNKGAEVRDFSTREIEDIYALRILLEGAAAERIVDAAPEDLPEQLRTIQALHDAAVHSGDLHAAFRANQTFHTALFAACGNLALAEAIEEQARRVHGVRFHSLLSPKLLEHARCEHWAMIQAVEARDREALVSLCREHLPPSREAYARAHPPIA